MRVVGVSRAHVPPGLRQEGLVAVVYLRYWIARYVDHPLMAGTVVFPVSTCGEAPTAGAPVATFLRYPGTV